MVGRVNKSRNGLYSASEAAKILGIHRPKIYELVRQEKLFGYPSSGRRFDRLQFSQDQLDAYLASRDGEAA